MIGCRAAGRRKGYHKLQSSRAAQAPPPSIPTTPAPTKDQLLGGYCECIFELHAILLRRMERRWCFAGTQAGSQCIHSWGGRDASLSHVWDWVW